MLAEIGDTLAQRGENVNVYVGGGAALALTYGEKARTVTDDIDALFGRNSTILAEAERIRQRDGLQESWFNDKFSAFVPSAVPDASASRLQLGGLNVTVASPEFLLAMKLHAGRKKDWKDIKFLVRDLGVSTAEEIAALAYRAYGDASVPAVDLEDFRLQAEAALRAIRREDTAAPAPDASAQKAVESTSSQMASDLGWSRRPAGTPRGGQFTGKRNSPPSSQLG